MKKSFEIVGTWLLSTLFLALPEAWAQGTSTANGPCPPGEENNPGVVGPQSAPTTETQGDGDRDEDEEPGEAKLVARQNGSGPPFRSFFFYQDGGSIDLYFKNETEGVSPDSCSSAAEGAAIVVTTEIDGPSSRFFSPHPSDFTLWPQTDKTIRLRLTPFTQFVTYMQADRLYAAKLRITAISDDGKELLDETFYIVRFLSVVSAREGANRTAQFLKTLADGANGFSRLKPIDFRLPTSVETTFVLTGGDTGVFHPGPDPRGSSRGEWRFDPIRAGQAQAQMAIFIDSQQIDGASLTLRGTGIEPTEVGVGRQGYQELLLQYLRDEIHLDDSNYSGSNIMRLASAPFRTEFAGLIETAAPVLPNGATMQQEIDHAAAVVAFRTRQRQATTRAGAALVAAVQRDYDLVNPPGIQAIDVVGDGGDVSTQWQLQTFFNGGEVLGFADGDAATDDLKKILPDDKLPLVAREYHLAELLNRSAANEAECGFLRQPGFGRTPDGPVPNPPSFADFVANTVSHELAHTFGLHDAYLHTLGGRINRPPHDIMREGRMPDPDLTFDNRHSTLLRAAMGVAPDAPGSLLTAMALYRNNINLPSSATGVRALSEEKDWVPVLAVRVGSEYLWSGDARSVGSVVADGRGGQQALLQLAIENAGQRPLTVNDAVLDDPDGPFSLAGDTLAGKTFAPGQSLPLTVALDPIRPGEATGTLRIISDGAMVRDFVVLLEGEGLAVDGRLKVELAEDPAWEVPTNNLGPARIGAPEVSRPAHLSLSNSGGGPLTITSIGPGSLGDGQFATSGVPDNLSPSHPIRLAAGQTLSVDLSFQAKHVGLQPGTIEIHSDDAERGIYSVPLIATGLPASGSALAYGRDFVAVESDPPGEQEPLRSMSDAQGRFSFDLTPETFFHLVIFDPDSGLIAHDYDRSAPDGQPTWLATPTFGGSTAPDTDGDFLPDDVELALGTDPSKLDSDDDGVTDHDALRRGLLSAPTAGQVADQATTAPQTPSDLLELLDPWIGEIATELGIEILRTEMQSRGSLVSALYKINGKAPSSSDLMKLITDRITIGDGEVSTTVINEPIAMLEAKKVEIGGRYLETFQCIFDGSQLILSVKP